MLSMIWNLNDNVPGGCEYDGSGNMSQIKQLSFEDRMELLELLTRDLRDERRPVSGKGPSLARVRGMLRPEGLPPTADELADSYTDYLMEKYH